MTPKYIFMYLWQKVIRENQISSSSSGTCGGIFGEIQNYIYIKAALHNNQIVI